MTPERTLTNLERDCWQQLTAASDQKESGFRTMFLATCNADGADARTVILRQVDAERRYIWFHTDARSPKVIELETYPSATLLLWDTEQQVQLRLTIETQLHIDDYVADEHWAKLSLSSRKSYLSEHRPGTVLPAPYPGFPERLGDSLPSAEESEAGRPNFAAIECRVLMIEYLHLHLNRTGQTRARFQYEPVEKFVWLAP